MAVNKQQQTTDFAVLPNSVEAEQSLLCCILRDSVYQLDIISQLSEKDFYQTNHQQIFSAMEEVSKNNLTVNFATTIDRLRRTGKLQVVGDIDYITKLLDLLPSTARFEEYLTIVKRASLMRSLISVCGEITTEAYKAADADAVLAYAEEKIFELSQHGNTGGLTDLSRVSTQALIAIGKRFTDPDAFTGIKTGYYRLDSMTNGFHGGELIILAARPGMGKSSLAMNFVENIALDGFNVAIFSLEMTNIQLVERLLSSMSGVPLGEIKSGRLSKGENDIASLSTANELINQKMRIYGKDTTVRMNDIRAQCRRLKAQNKLDFVVIDYIGLIPGSDVGGSNYADRQNQVASISRGLKAMAKELDVPVLALSQVKRDVEIRNIGKKSEEEAEPVLSDLRESGAIEQDADIVMFIHQRSKEEGKLKKAELIIAKHRNGETGSIPLTWRGEWVRFDDEKMLQRFTQSIYRQSTQQEQAEPAPQYDIDSSQQFELHETTESTSDIDVDSFLAEENPE